VGLEVGVVVSSDELARAVDAVHWRRHRCCGSTGGG
jgi:hypothetical protein